MAENSRLTSRARTALWIAGVALVASAPLVAILASGRTLVWRDSGRLFAPLRVLVVEALRDGRLPAWNPFEGLGMPLFAQAMHSVLHPVSVAAAFLAPGAGLDPIIVAHVILAATGAFVLAREVGASAAGAAVSGLAFGLSGYVLSMSSIVQYLAAAGTAPWTVAALLAAGKGRRFGLPAAAVVVAIQAFAGDPQWLLLSAALGLGLAWAAGGAGGAGRAVVGIVTGAALGAVQLVPSWEYFRETTRAVMLDDIDRVQWALSPLRLAELVVPGLFFGRPGEGSAPVFTWLGGPSTYLMPFVPSVFVGGATVWLALAGARASRATRFLAVATVVLLWIALGTWLGATQVLRGIPVWGAFRYAEKMVGPLTLCLAVLAGVGADRIEPGRRPHSWPVPWQPRPGFSPSWPPSGLASRGASGCRRLPYGRDRGPASTDRRPGPGGGRAWPFSPPPSGWHPGAVGRGSLHWPPRPWPCPHWVPRRSRSTPAIGSTATTACSVR